LAYIGTKPTIGNFQICDAISVVNGQAAYTMQVGSVNVIPQSANHMIVSLNGTIQKPNSSFTVSGSTITFASNLATGDVIDFIQILGDVLDLGVPSDATVTAAKLGANSVTAAKLNNDIISGTTELASEPADTDEFLVSDAGTLKRIDYSLIKSSFNPDGAQVFNESGADVDFRIESDDSTHGFFLEGDSGNIYVGTNSGSIGNSYPGVKMFGTDDSTNKSGMNIVTAGANNPLSLNRSAGDGTLIGFRSAGTEEGTISISGTTTSYNGFTGTHWSRFEDNSKPTILKGTVLETLDVMCDWYNLKISDGDLIPHVLLDGQSIGDKITYNHNGTDVETTIVKEDDIKHMMCKVSDTTEAKNVYGVFNSWEQGDEGYNDFLVASVGSYVVRIKSGQTIAKGNLLQSNGDGTAKVQSDDNIKSSSFAKVLSTTKIETYEDGSFIVPCSLMC